MFNPRITAFVAITAVVFIGTGYSVTHNTYLDTSNPLLTHLPHPLHKSHYFATKSNFLNVYFIKNAWAWTSAAFLFSWITSPPSARTKQQMLKWVMETIVWLVFTSWFFGPAIFERVIIASGGECMLSLPSGDAISVPQQYCFTKTIVSPATHPGLFTAASLESLLPNSEWHAKPRLRRGHDVSGHIFLLTMSILFLADQLRPSLRARSWPTLHRWAIGVNLSLIAIWLFASWTTSVYFHSPLEKVTGYFLGVAGFVVTQLSILETTPHETPTTTLKERRHAS